MACHLSDRLTGAGYQIYAVNPLQAAATGSVTVCRAPRATPLMRMCWPTWSRTDRDRLRPVAGDSAGVEAVNVLARAHKTLIWECTRHVLRLRHALLEFFPAALVAFEDLSAVDALDLFGGAPDPAAAAALSTAQITAALKRARRRYAAAKAEQIATALRAEHLGQPAVVTAAYPATVRAQVAILATLNTRAARGLFSLGCMLRRHWQHWTEPGLNTHARSRRRHRA